MYPLAVFGILSLLSSQESVRHLITLTAVLTVISKFFLHSTVKKILFYNALSEESNAIVIY